MATHTDHLAQAAAGLRLLGDPDRHPWPDVAKAAADVPLHVYRALLALDEYTELTPADQAEVCAMLAEGHVIGEHARREPTPALHARITHLAAECAHFAAWCDPSQTWPTDSDRAGQLDRAADNATAYGVLDPVWQAQVMDRLTPPDEPSTRLLRALNYTARPAPAPRPHLDEVLAEAFQHRVETPADATTTGQDLVGRLSRMPPEWQLHVMRRLDLGVPPLDAIGSAAMARNLGYNRFGLGGWHAPTPSSPPTG